jgi:hypothetical protein
VDWIELAVAIPHRRFLVRVHLVTSLPVAANKATSSSAASHSPINSANPTTLKSGKDCLTRPTSIGSGSTKDPSRPWQTR